jgi:hypothetical protein
MADTYQELDEPVDVEVQGTLAVGALVACVEIAGKEDGETIPSLLFKFANSKGEFTPAVCLVLGDQEYDDFIATCEEAIKQVKERRQGDATG